MSPDHPPRLGALAAWLQQAGEAILYHPDGLSADNPRPASVPLGALSLVLCVDAPGFAAGCTAAARSLQGLGEAMARAGQAAAAFREAMPAR